MPRRIFDTTSYKNADMAQNSESPPTAAQVRAARALLAWSQSELAKQAKVATSTVADFERGSRTPVANNIDAIRSVLENSGITFLSGGAVAGRPSAPVPQFSSGMPLRWIDSTDLSHWADRRDGQAMLPELVARLILAQYGTHAALRFPFGDSVQFAGWDGASFVDSDNSFVPSGAARWEFGAQKNRIADKANEDYAHRKTNPLDADPAGTTYVQVTPRRWPGKGQWAASKEAEHYWRAVRVLDGDDLIHWIERHPGVGHWLAVVIGKRPVGLRQLGEVWDEWALATAPTLPWQLVLANRDEESARVLRWLLQPPSVLTVQAETSEEAIAFLHATIAQLPPQYRESQIAHCLVSTTGEATRALKQSLTPLTIATPENEPGLCQDMALHGHHVFVALGAEAGTDVGNIVLPRPHREEVRQALQDMGFREAEIERLSNDAGRSLTILRRLIPASPGRVPFWASNAVPSLVAALVAGAWSDSNPGDREILERLSGEPYDKLSQELTRLATFLDSPVQKSGDAWKIVSPRDAWLLLAPNLTESLATRFFSDARKALGERDPLFSLTGEQRWMAPVRGVNAKYSALLRQGLGETLILFGLYGERSKGVSQPAERVAMLVDSILEKADESRWWSLRNDFRRLAEAAPDAFLSALESALSSDQSPLSVLFGEDKEDVFGREHLSGMLRALEQLAWSRAHFARVAQILSSLDAIDPGGRFSNRPANSLRDTFSLWSPQTTLTLVERIKVLDRLRSSHADVAWKLMLKLIPSEYETSTPSAHPLWRDFGIDDVEPVTYAIIAEGVGEIASRLLADVGNSAMRWTQMIQSLSNFPTDIRAKIAQELANTLPSIEVSAYEPLRDALRRLIGHHRQFPDAKWAMGSDELDALENIYSSTEPDDLIARHAWLFSNHPTIPRLPDSSWETHQRVLSELRLEAVAAILKKRDTTLLFAFADAVPWPGFVGAAIIESKPSKKTIAEIIDKAFNSERANVQILAHGMLVRGRDLIGKAWAKSLMQRAIKNSWSAAVCVRVLRAMPMERATWDLVASLGSEIEREYWKIAQIFAVPNDAPTADLTFIVRKQIELGHGRQAVFFAGQHLRPEMDAELLDQALRAAAQDESKIDAGNEATMFAHYVGEILDTLDGNQSFAPERIAQLEWIYFPALRNARRRTRQLYAALASDPGFFVDLLRLVYRPTPESGVVEAEPMDKERAKIMASQAWGLLHDWRRVPGSDEAGQIDGATLEEWVKQARILCANAGRAEIGDQCIGNILAAAPVRGDEIWPPVPIREVIETARSKHLQIGFALGVKNRRGVTSRGILDGGMQERDLAARYRRWAAETQLEWPRTSSTLLEIAGSYEADGRRFDVQAERNEW